MSTKPLFLNVRSRDVDDAQQQLSIAPMWMWELGLEWILILIQEPKISLTAS